MGSPDVVVGLRVGSAEAIAPNDVISAVHITILVEVTTENRGEGDEVGICSAGEIHAALCVAVFDLIRIRAEGEQTVVIVSAELAAIPSAGIANERKLRADGKLYGTLVGQV